MSGRFRLAVSLGFVIATAGAVTLGVAARQGEAQSLFGGLPDLFGGGLFGQQPAPVAQAYDAYRQDAPYRTRRHPRTARHGDERLHAVRFDGARHHDAPMGLALQSMCVRLCDGFAFPVGAYHGSEDNASHEATCRSECPGAQTALYVSQAGASGMDDATDVRSGAAYSELPDAFHYTTVLSDACSCHAKTGGRIASLLRDFTLRRGDAVMTKRGLQVFHGGGHFPFKRQDFVALAKSPDIHAAHRASYRAIERASLAAPTNVAQNDAVKLSEMTGPTRPERQASR